MAIVKMSRFDLMAFKGDKDALLRGLQHFSHLQFVDAESDEDLGELVSANELQIDAGAEEDLHRVKTAIDLIHRYTAKAGGIKAMMEGRKSYTMEEAEGIIQGEKWKHLHQKLREIGTSLEVMQAKMAKISSKIEEFTPWSGFDAPFRYLKETSVANCYIGSVPKKLRQDLTQKLSELTLTHVEVVGGNKDEDYLLILSHPQEKEQLEQYLSEGGFSASTVDYQGSPSDESAALQEEMQHLKSQRKQLIEKLKTYEEHLPTLEVAYDYLSNMKLREESKANLLTTSDTCLIRGWVPTEKIQELEKEVQKAVGDQFLLQCREATKDDENVPISLKNSDFAASFESLTAMYAYPTYDSIDPTPILAPFYLIFFGMMAADVGYGIVLLLLTVFALKKFNLQTSQRRFVKFFFYLSFSVMAWGLLYGSYFGSSIPGMWRLIDPATQYMTLLIASIAMGLVHVFVGLGIKAYLCFKAGQPLDALYDVGFWYMAVGGAVMFLGAGSVDGLERVSSVGKWVMIVGMIGIVLTGGRTAQNIFAKLGGGLYALYGISGYVGDLVSYSRLMALGLAGGFIAQAINMMAGMVSKSFIGLVFAPIILIAGHAFNIFLSYLGAYVHTARLTYVEFFGKFYEGGGKSFRNFRSKDKYVDLQ